MVLGDNRAPLEVQVVTCVLDEGKELGNRACGEHGADEGEDFLLDRARRGEVGERGRRQGDFVAPPIWRSRGVSLREGGRGMTGRGVQTQMLDRSTGTREPSSATWAPLCLTSSAVRSPRASMVPDASPASPTIAPAEVGIRLSTRKDPDQAVPVPTSDETAWSGPARQIARLACGLWTASSSGMLSRRVAGAEEASAVSLTDATILLASCGLESWARMYLSSPGEVGGGATVMPFLVQGTGVFRRTVVNTEVDLRTLPSSCESLVRKSRRASADLAVRSGPCDFVCAAGAAGPDRIVGGLDFDSLRVRRRAGCDILIGLGSSWVSTDGRVRGRRSSSSTGAGPGMRDNAGPGVAPAAKEKTLRRGVGATFSDGRL